MAAILHFNWKPKRSTDVRPLDRAPALKRHDTWATEIRLMTNGATPTPRDVSALSYAAQIREEPVVTGVATGAPLAEMDVDMTDAATGVLVLRLTSDQTRDLPSAGFWDLQQDDGGTLTTLIAGKIVVVDDVTRPVV